MKKNIIIQRCLIVFIIFCNTASANIDGFYDEDFKEFELAIADPQQVNKTLRLAESKKNEGQIDQALVLLTSLIEQYGATLNHNYLALAYMSLSDAHLLLRDIEKANHYLNLGSKFEAEIKDSLISASLLNHSANIAMAQSNFSAALGSYQKALVLALNNDDRYLIVSLRLNQIHALIADNQAFRAFKEIPAAKAAIELLAPGKQRRHYQISLGHLTSILYPVVGDKQLLNIGYEILTATLTDTKTLPDDPQKARLESSIYGYMGILYVQANKADEAENLLQRAVFFANLAEAPELSAKWYAHLAKLYQSQNKIDAAQHNYWQAISALQAIRPAIVYGQRGNPQYFQRNVVNVYMDLAKVLLQLAVTADRDTEKQKRLHSAVEVLEQLSIVELEDYFLDDCVANRQVQSSTMQGESLLSDGEVAIYPILTDKHIITLLSFSNDRIHYHAEAISKVEVQERITDFQRSLVQPGTPRRLRKNSFSLYQSLIAPLEAVLKDNNIHTIVVIPDTDLRGIPFSALFDGNGFLIERFAFATTPGLGLISAKNTNASKSVLLNGLTKGVQGFNQLSHVRKEIDNVAALHSKDNVTILLNEEFNRSGIQAALSKGSLHTMSFSTHAEIRSNPRESFILTHDGRISFDEFDRLIRASQYGEDSIDLLVLSACDSAYGDERAALGLAGVAVKAGARSVLATLWAVNDASTAELIPEFFKARNIPELGKAKALQYAQKRILKDPRYNHPFYWAPFIMIGHWK